MFKIRNGFVSNSSSASFIIGAAKIVNKGNDFNELISCCFEQGITVFMGKYSDFIKKYFIDKELYFPADAEYINGYTVFNACKDSYSIVFKNEDDVIIFGEGYFYIDDLVYRTEDGYEDYSTVTLDKLSPRLDDIINKLETSNEVEQFDYQLLKGRHD